MTITELFDKLMTITTNVIYAGAILMILVGVWIKKTRSDTYGIMLILLGIIFMILPSFL